MGYTITMERTTGISDWREVEKFEEALDILERSEDQPKFISANIFDDEDLITAIGGWVRDEYAGGVEAWGVAL